MIQLKHMQDYTVNDPQWQEEQLHQENLKKNLNWFNFDLECLLLK